MCLKMLEKPHEKLQISVPSNGERIVPMIKTKDAVITVKSVYDGDKTDRQAFIELILQK